MSTLTIHDAQPQDYPAIDALITTAYVDAGHFPNPSHDYLQTQSAASRATTSQVLTATIGGSLAGTATITPHDAATITKPGEHEIRLLAVHPQAQSHGIASALIHHAKNQHPALALITGGHWKPARHLYEKHGFRRAPERDQLVPGTNIELVAYVWVTLKPGAIA